MSLCQVTVKVCSTTFLVQRLTDELDDREDEIRRLRSKVRELEDALSQSKMSARTAEVQRSEVGESTYLNGGG